MSRDRITGSYTNSVCSFIRNLHTFLHNNCSSLHFQRQCRGFAFSSHPFQHLLLVGFFDDSYSDWCEVKNVTVVLIFISLIISDVKHLFICFLAICTSLEKCLFRSSTRFLIGLFDFLMLSFMSCLCILEMDPLLVSTFANIFYHSEGCLLSCLWFLLLFKTFEVLLGPIYFCFYFLNSRR